MAAPRGRKAFGAVPVAPAYSQAELLAGEVRRVVHNATAKWVISKYEGRTGHEGEALTAIMSGLAQEVAYNVALMNVEGKPTDDVPLGQIMLQGLGQLVMGWVPEFEKQIRVQKAQAIKVT